MKYEINVKYPPGTKIWSIIYSRGNGIKCVACKGIGKVKINKEYYTCPKCLGYKLSYPMINIIKSYIIRDFSYSDGKVSYITWSNESFMESAIYTTHAAAEKALMFMGNSK